MQVGLGPGHIDLDGNPARPPPRKGAQHPQFLAHVYRRQTAGWIMMPLSMEVVHGRHGIVLDGKPAPYKNVHSSQFSAHVSCGQTAGMHQDATL